ncbi:hypothetical protein PCA20602_02775 [Pandoraea capi]|uniref:OmpR/PhoB-type domain-containing protein n=1 Tax=Pandoraea capi TaxID=2508286 RepID=A0ABY6W170_9BURK|nr:winged helix-turn-helix domain-containing protein [Pandoraea capi]VVE13761.1 hypothetical protein PCA20602_02775 [Pandoraea capi]
MPKSPFDLDDVTNLVHHNGIAARLSEQEKRLLVLLAGRAGTAFEKHALMQALWGRRAQWMEDAALVQLVSRLRRSLAPLGLQRAIVTVARVGYRFEMPSPSPATPTAEPTTEPSIADRGSERPHAVTDALCIDDSTGATSLALPLQHGVARDGHGEVRRHGVIVKIPQIEYRLLCALRSPVDVVHDKRTLIAMLWPARPDQDDTNLMQVVSRLRRKLIPLGLHRHIVTVPRVGYRFASGDTALTPTPDPTDVSAQTPGASQRAGTGMSATWHRARLALHALRALTRRLRWRDR